ncbi:PAS domain-containing protein [Emcibacter nanhaiensis]|uniref:PAS domain-containing protein n=1 Tax=Emcibacter nanhaiensis TaxID=1505037 RepID=A0A501PNT6_9PROT|nr:PAS domain-containing protein [Emcibacter nanhaiensis]TPD61446.1 PAS domain-containing protein [Emcibacter nanhaiensis]
MDPENMAGQERRITFQLYDHWIELAGEREMPSLRELSPDDIAPYKDQMVLIDLRDKDQEASLQVIGHALKEDLEEDLTGKCLSDIPRRTMLSRITDHYLEVFANRAPISFEAEFVNKEKERALYRGILLPFSDNNEEINFILGAVRWILEKDMPPREAVMPEAPAGEEIPAPAAERPLVPLEQQMLECRRLAQGETAADSRSRKSLYRALAAILDFYIDTGKAPQEYQQLLQQEGLKVQKRAPITPVLKLCFGADYDKTRLTEYAAALDFALTNGQTGNTLEAFLESFKGGIKGCVRARREHASGLPSAATKNSLEEAEKIVKNMPTIAGFDLTENIPQEDQADPDKEDFCLILGKRKGTSVEIIKLLGEEEERTLAALLKRVAKDQH